MTRCAKTWVLPDPALAATQAETCGFEASICLASTSWGMARSSFMRAPRAPRRGRLPMRAKRSGVPTQHPHSLKRQSKGPAMHRVRDATQWVAAPSLPVSLGFAAGQRPFLHPGEVVVLAVTRAPHRMNERAVGRRFVSKALRDAGEAAQRRIGLAVAGSLLEIDRALRAGRLAAFQQDVGEFTDRCRLRNPGKAALAQDCGFKRELGRKAGAHLLLGARLAGLVVEDDVASVGPALDAVVARGQAKDTLADPDGNLAADLRLRCGGLRSPLRLPGGEPAGDALKARPPEGPRFREVVERREG